mmetsp:Transcript_11578/g.34753  ORF Transcript_11578/g.34753 Transcript_11578/m.34753 type:complete len:321 (+) Transcript_11578:5681-6643(+)
MDALWSKLRRLPADWVEGGERMRCQPALMSSPLATDCFRAAAVAAIAAAAAAAAGASASSLSSTVRTASLEGIAPSRSASDGRLAAASGSDVTADGLPGLRVRAASFNTRVPDRGGNGFLADPAARLARASCPSWDAGAGREVPSVQTVTASPCASEGSSAAAAAAAAVSRRVTSEGDPKFGAPSLEDAPQRLPRECCPEAGAVRRRMLRTVLGAPSRDGCSGDGLGGANPVKEGVGSASPPALAAPSPPVVAVSTAASPEAAGAEGFVAAAAALRSSEAALEVLAVLGTASLLAATSVAALICATSPATEGRSVRLEDF